MFFSDRLLLDLSGVVVSYGQDGEPVCVEFPNASARKLLDRGELNVALASCAYVAAV